MLFGIIEKCADMIYVKRGIQFGAFKLKLHETNPDAPLSPFYINLRSKDNPKPGPFVGKDFELIARCIYKVIKDAGDDLVFDAIAPIPRAGDPLVDAMERTEGTYSEHNQGDYRIIRLGKAEEGETRKIVPLPGFEYRKDERVLLVDDLVTKAHTKLEAIKAIESSGSIVVGLVVLIDREQGGKEEIEKAGYKLYSAFTISELFAHYQATKKIKTREYVRYLNYVQNN